MTKDNPAQAPGEIITFYSYKGGTGRSMALANVAWILAVNRKRVLVIDWDLEAPGLHRYFRPFLIDKFLTSSEGLIDFVIDFADEVIKPAEPGELPADWYIPYADITRLALSVNYGDFPTPGKIDFIPAGLQSSTYATRVNSFNWQNFYDRLGGGAFFEAAKQHMRNKYDYILIDSRTGVSDTAGICTVQIPDTLAVFFTYNNQSIEGAGAVAKSVLQARQKLPGESNADKLKIFPVPTRVEQSELDKLNARQHYAQQVFEEHLSAKIDRQVYWSQIEVPYVPYYGYEEILAAINDDPNDPKKVLKPLVSLTSYLTQAEVSDFTFPISPGKKNEILQQFAEIPLSVIGHPASTRTITETPTQELVRVAESNFQHLSRQYQEESPRVWTRLVRVARPEEGGDHARMRIKSKEFSPIGYELVLILAKARLLSVAVDRERANGEETVEIMNETLIHHWPRLREWIGQDFYFLTWRQKLRELVQDWENFSYKDDFLLSGLQLRQARDMLDSRHDDLNDAEIKFINASLENELAIKIKLEYEHYERRSKRRKHLTILIVSIFFITLSSMAIYYRIQIQEAEQIQSLSIQQAEHFRNALKSLDKKSSQEKQALICELSDFENTYDNPFIKSAKDSLARLCIRIQLTVNESQPIIDTNNKRIIALAGKIEPSSSVNSQLETIDNIELQINKKVQTLEVEKDEIQRQQLKKDTSRLNSDIQQIISRYPLLKQAGAAGVKAEAAIKVQEAVINKDVDFNGSGLPEKVYQKSSWFKEGYYLQFENIKVSLKELYANPESIQVVICDQIGDAACRSPIGEKQVQINLGKPYSFSYAGNLYIIKLDRIGRAGKNPFKPAAYVTFIKYKQELRNR